MALNERYEWSLVVLILYVGLADGYLKLSTGSSNATLLRDLLLYAIVVGALIRFVVRGRTLELPPLSGWVFAWVGVVLIQLANPSNGTMMHSLSALRPHAEWVPLFFLAYFVMRSNARIKGFLLLLVVVAATNGVVGLIQIQPHPGRALGLGPGIRESDHRRGRRRWCLGPRFRRQ